MNYILIANCTSSTCTKLPVSVMRMKKSFVIKSKVKSNFYYK